MIKPIKSFFEQRRVRKIFGKYVAPSVVDDLLIGKPSSSQAEQFKEKSLGLVLTFVEYSAPKEVAKKIALIFDLAKEHEAGYEATTNGLIVFSFGKFRSETDSEVSRHTFVKRLQTQLGMAVKIVHGRGVGYIGTVSNEQILNYTLLMPKFDEALQSLSCLNYGEAKEIAFS